MKKIFSSPDPVNTRLLAAYLESRGFEVLVQGEDRQTSAGGIPPLECWPEIVLVQDEQEPEATQAIEEFSKASTGPAEKEKWTCPTCGEQLESQFAECWKCQPAAAREESSVAQIVIAIRRWFSRFWTRQSFGPPNG